MAAEETAEEMVRRLQERQRRIERLNPVYLEHILKPKEREPKEHRIGHKYVRPITEKEKKNKYLLLKSTVATPVGATVSSTEEYLQRALDRIKDPGMTGPINGSPGFWDTIREVFYTQDKRQIHLLKQILKIAQLRGNLFRFYPGGGYELLDMLNNCPHDLIMPIYDFVLQHKLNEGSTSPLFSKGHRLKREKKQFIQEQNNMIQEDVRLKEKTKPKEKEERRTMAEEDFPRQAEQQQVRDRVLKKINEQKYGAEPEGSGLQNKRPNQWIQFVKDWSKKHKISYGHALSNPKLSADYRKHKGRG